MYTEARHWFLGYKGHSPSQILVLKADRSSRLQVLMSHTALITTYI